MENKQKTKFWQELEKFYFVEYRDVDHFVSELNEFINKEKELSYQQGVKEEREKVLEEIEKFAFNKIKQESIRYPEFIKGINRCGADLLKLLQDIKNKL